MFSTLKSQKGLAPIIIILIAVGIVVVVGGIYWWQNSAKEVSPVPTLTTPATPTSPTSTPTPATLTKTHTEYKQILTLKLAYDNDEKKMNRAPEEPEGPIEEGELPEEDFYFDKDNEDNIYIGYLGQIKVFAPSGDSRSIFHVDLESNFINDFVVDEEGNIYMNDIGSGPVEESLYKYTPDGVSQTKISIDENLSNKLRKNGFFRTYIVNNKIYAMTGYQISYLIGIIKNGVLEKAEPLKFQGILGSTSGNWYKVNRIEEFNKGEVNILDSTGNISRTFNMEIKGLASIQFLGEDQEGNIYIQIEKTPASGIGVELEVHKFDLKGNYLTIVSIPNDAYGFFWSNKLLLLGKDGSIWQVLPADDGRHIHINKWSTIY